MPKKAQWPPQPKPHKSGLDRVRWQGHDYYTGPTGTEEAQRKYAELLAKLAAGGQPSKPPPKTEGGLTIKELVARWMEDVAPSYSKEGRGAKQATWSFRPLLALYGSTPASSFDAERLEVVQLAMAQGSWKEGAQSCCALIVRNRLGWIKRLWRWAERKKLVPTGAWANLCTVPCLRAGDPRVRVTPKRRPCTFSDLLAVVKAAPKVVGAMLLLAFWSGMRPGEIRVLKASEVDASGPEWIYRPPLHKGTWRGQERVVVLGPKAQAVLRPWLLAAKNYVFPPSRKRKDGRTHYESSNFARAVRRARIKAGVKGLHAYLCRHASKQRVTREMGLDAARAYLGQHSLDVTNQYGDAVDLELAKRAARKLG